MRPGGLNAPHALLRREREREREDCSRPKPQAKQSKERDRAFNVWAYASTWSQAGPYTQQCESSVNPYLSSVVCSWWRTQTDQCGARE